MYADPHAMPEPRPWLAQSIAPIYWGLQLVVVIFYAFAVCFGRQIVVAPTLMLTAQWASFGLFGIVMLVSVSDPLIRDYFMMYTEEEDAAPLPEATMALRRAGNAERKRARGRSGRWRYIILGAFGFVAATASRPGSGGVLAEGYANSAMGLCILTMMLCGAMQILLIGYSPFGPNEAPYRREYI